MDQIAHGLDSELRVGAGAVRGRCSVGVGPGARDAQRQRVGMLDYQLGLAAAQDLERHAFEWVVSPDDLDPRRRPELGGVLLSL